MKGAVLDLRSSCSQSLETYRDFAFAASWAARHGVELRVEFEESHRRGLDWLGLPYRQGAIEGRADFAGEASLPLELSGLPALVDPAGRSLEELRAEGYLSETVFAALIRANYGEDSFDYFPTRMELSLTYSPERLRRGESRWDEAYLEACQRFFMEELTPAEVLQKVGEELTGEAREAYEALLDQAREKCEGLALLAVETTPRLTPVVELFSGLAQCLGNPQPTQEGEPLFSGFEEVADEMVEVLGGELLARVRGERAELR